MENTTKQIETVAIPKELHEKIENRHEKRNQIIDFIKQNGLYYKYITISHLLSWG